MPILIRETTIRANLISEQNVEETPVDTKTNAVPVADSSHALEMRMQKYLLRSTKARNER
ncbi:MAG: hypothetical protein IPM98_12970 [Lewinellaceae bacterium]|nr:hypothetical protein [Lewinellaceae bacterium]